MQKYFKVVDFTLFIGDQKIPSLKLPTDRRQLNSQLAIGSVGRPVVLFLTSDSRQRERKIFFNSFGLSVPPKFASES
mgnify:CR=1 FL=1